MATNQVPVVQVNVALKTLTSEELEKQDKEAKKTGLKTSVFDQPGDSLDVKTPKTVGISSTAEGKAPSGRSPFERLKAAGAALAATLKKAGFEVKPTDDNLVATAQTALDELDAEITRILERGSGKGDESANLERERDGIIEGLGAFEAIKAEAEGGTVTVQSTGAEEGTGEARTDASPQEVEALWDSLRKDFETLGLRLEPGEADVQLVHNKSAALFTKELEKLNTQAAALTDRKTALEEQLKTASPEDKKLIEAELKTIKTDLDRVLAQKQSLQVAFVRVNDALIQFQVSKDLGMSFKKETKTETKTATVQSASAKKPEGSGSSATVTTSSAGGTPRSGSAGTGTGGGVTINTASAGGSAPVFSNPTDEAGGGVVGTASAGDGGAESAPLTGSTNVQTMSAMNDFSGTTLAIASTTSTLQRDSRRTEEAIKKLLRAAASGNYEAIKTALIMLDKRASQIVIGMGSATIKAMQNYEKQMGALSKSLDALKTTDASYNAKLAQVNSQMNIYSMNRQAIANFLQQTLQSREEIGNTTKGFISKDGQIGSAMSRW